MKIQQGRLFFIKMQQDRLFFMKMQLGVNCDVLIYFKQQNVLFFTENAKECVVFH